MARRVIRRESELIRWHKDGRRIKDADKWYEVPVYRIEWPDGTPTDTGLFVSHGAAEVYARGRGWPLGIGEEEECA